MILTSPSVVWSENEFTSCSNSVEWSDLYGDGPVSHENLLGRSYLDVNEVRVSQEESRIRFVVKTVDGLDQFAERERDLRSRSKTLKADPKILPTGFVEFNIDRESEVRDQNPVSKDQTPWPKKVSTTVVALSLRSDNGFSVIPEIEIINPKPGLKGILPPMINAGVDEVDALISLEDLGILASDRLSIRVVELIPQNRGPSLTSTHCLNVVR